MKVLVTVKEVATVEDEFEIEGTGIADYAIVDLFDVVPALTEEFQSERSARHADLGPVRVREQNVVSDHRERTGREVDERETELIVSKLTLLAAAFLRFIDP